MAKISVMGTGSWGTALAILLHNNGHQVMLWSAHPEKAASLNQTREDPKKLPGIKIPDGIVITGDEKTALDSPDIVVFASPSAYMRAISKRLSPLIRQGQIIVNVAKGVEENTLMPVCDIIKEEIPQADVCVLSGPSHAEEVGIGLPTTVVAGAKKRAVAEEIQDIFMNNVFRVYTSPDVLGMELGGSLKNVIALAAGMADGLGYGDNTKAALITRGMFEMNKLAVTMGAKQETLNGLTGIGDLIVTCESKHSRNRKAGMLIGQGYTMQQAMDEVKMVVEGVYSAKAAIALAKKYGVDMPIIEEVNKVLFEDKPAKEAVNDLMLRDKKMEHGNLGWED